MAPCTWHEHVFVLAINRSLLAMPFNFNKAGCWTLPPLNLIQWTIFLRVWVWYLAFINTFLKKTKVWKSHHRSCHFIPKMSKLRWSKNHKIADQHKLQSCFTFSWSSSRRLKFPSQIFCQSFTKCLQLNVLWFTLAAAN